MALGRLARRGTGTRIGTEPTPRPGFGWPGPIDYIRAAVAAAVCVLLTLAFAQELADENSRGITDFGIALTVLACVPIAFRRVAPVPAAVITMLVACAGGAANYPMTGPIVIGLVLVGLAASRAETRSTETLGVFSGLTIATLALLSADTAPVLAVVSGFAVGMVPALIGEGFRAERERTRDAREMARQVEELRDRDVQKAVAEERLRIARDVHDITGHHLSAISLQSAGASRTTDDPVARAAFETIHGLTTEALGQTSRSLGILREASDPAVLAPLPRLAHAEQLLEPARSAGIGAELVLSGRPRELAETIELCAYRVIQESLTNVVRHAGAGSVQVVVDYGEALLTVRIEDDGRGGPVNYGSGIEGMRERVALVDGSLTAGPRDDAGWAVRATLPIEGPR